MTNRPFVRLIVFMVDAATLVRLYAPAVYGLCRAMVRDTALAEDLSQETFVRAFAALESFRGEASPRTWLLKIARNRCLDHLEHVRRAPWGRDPDPEPDEHATEEPAPIDLLARRDDAQRAMAVLGESERALVVLHFGHGVGYPELAESFGLGQGAIRMRVSRALARMRAAIHEDVLESTAQSAPTLDPYADAFDEEAPWDDLEERSSAGAPALADPAVPATFPALYDDPSPQLWQRLAALAR